MFDSREADLPYFLTTRVNGKAIDFYKPMADPFHNTTVTTRWGWRDRLRILFGKPTVVTVSVDATRAVVEAVSELDANYRGATGSERRRQADAEIDRALRKVWRPWQLLRPRGWAITRCKIFRREPSLPRPAGASYRA